MLFGRSGKLKEILKGTAGSEEGEGPCHTVRPLCPTRWTARTGAIRAVLNQYECMIQALAETAASECETAGEAQGLYETLQQGNVVLGLVCALEITGELDILNMSLQSRTQSLDGRLSAVACVQEKVLAERETQRVFRLFTRKQRGCVRLSVSLLLPLLVSVSHLSASQVVLLHIYVCPLLTTTGLSSIKLWMLLTCSLEKDLSRKECKR